MTEREDTGLVELSGRHWLTSQLLRAGLEVAQPERDRGIDLIVYLDLDEGVGDFLACPIQMKAASAEPFSVDQVDERFRRLLLVYVVNLADSSRTAAYAMTYAEAAQVVQSMGVATQGYWAVKGLWRWPYISPRLRELLAPYLMTQSKWRTKIIEVATRSGPSSGSAINH